MTSTEKVLVAHFNLMVALYEDIGEVEKIVASTDCEIMKKIYGESLEPLWKQYHIIKNHTAVQMRECEAFSEEQVDLKAARDTLDKSVRAGKNYRETYDAVAKVLGE